MAQLSMRHDLPDTRHVKVNPLSPHDALKHHFTSLKTVLICLQLLE